MNSLGFCCWCFLLSKLSDSFSSYSFSFFVFLHLARLYDGEDSRRRRTDCTTQKYLLLLFFFSFLISTTTIISTITKKSIKLTKRLMNLLSLSLSVCWFKSSDNFHYNLSIWWQFFVCCFFYITNDEYCGHRKMQQHSTNILHLIWTFISILVFKITTKQKILQTISCYYYYY